MKERTVKIGDLVKFRQDHKYFKKEHQGFRNFGVVIDIPDKVWAIVSWAWMDGRCGKNFQRDLEVIK